MLIIWCVRNSIGVLTSCSWRLSQFLHVGKWRKLRFKLIAKDSPEFLWLFGFSGIYIKPYLVAKTLDYGQQVSTNCSSVQSYKAVAYKLNWEIEKPILFYRVHQILSPDYIDTCAWYCQVCQPFQANQRTAGPPGVFMKDPAMNWLFYGQLFDFFQFFENCGYISSPSLSILRTVVRSYSTLNRLKWTRNEKVRSFESRSGYRWRCSDMRVPSQFHNYFVNKNLHPFYWLRIAIWSLILQITQVEQLLTH